MERDSFIFYKSFYDAFSELDPETKAKCYEATAQYGLYGTIPELSGAALAIFTLVKPQLDANNKRYLNGSKGKEFGKLGGRPKKNATGVIDENPKETPKKPLENPKETPNVNVNDNVNDNDNDNVNVKVKKEKPAPVKKEYGEHKKVKLTDQEYQKLVNEFGEIMTKRAIEFLDGYIVDKGYKSKDNYMAMRRWVFDAVREQDAKRRTKASNSFNQFPQNGFSEDLESMLLDN